jgi:hypothetical protein
MVLQYGHFKNYENAFKHKKRLLMYEPDCNSEQAPGHNPAQHFNFLSLSGNYNIELFFNEDSG